MHLTVVGQVSAGSSGDTVGGLAGKNYGKLVDCAFEGSVRGGSSVGGLAGQNTGSLVGCENQGDVNTTVVEVQADLSDITLLRTTESVPAGTDIGGIAGYEHMGYNVGGIAGRQSGYLDGCTNTGTVQGRKDVGGIAGQMSLQAAAEAVCAAYRAM